ncbi:MAG: radical SAM protein [Sedimenticola sp.]
MSISDKEKDRDGKSDLSITNESPVVDKPGHKLRSESKIIDREQLPDGNLHSSELESLDGQSLEYVKFKGQEGIMRIESGTPSMPVPNQFTGPSFRNKKERFRFDGHKMLYHLDRIQAWNNGERFSPIHIDMGLTKFCNTACLYCYAVVQNMTKGKMIEREPLLRFIDDCGRLGVRSLGFIGDGEPTLNPALYDATRRAGDLGIDVSMATNGLLLDRERMDVLLENMSWIRFNLSAGTPEGFRKVHQSGEKNFHLLVDNIREMVRIKREKGYQCTLGLQMVLIPECFDQVLEEAKLGAELGVDYFVIKHCSDSEYKELDIDYDEFLKLEDMLKEAESLSADDYVVQVKWNKINAAGETEIYRNGYRKYDVCLGTPFLLQISGNGEVYPCGPFFNKKRFYIGDLHNESFYDLVNSDHYWDVHADIEKSVDVHKDCAIGCRQDYVNKFLWDLKNPPEHINFI